MNLTPHFTLEELTTSDTAQRCCIDNTPSEEIQANLTTLAQGLEAVRNLLGFSMRVTSGYRCPELNTRIGGAKDSAHTQGFAADFVCPQRGDPLELVRLITQSRIDFDQLIQEGTWVHISFDPRKRREVLTAHFNPGQPTTYTKGL